MADPTTNFGWDLPNNGTEADTWGATLNAVLQSIDTELWAHLPRAGTRAMSGTLTFRAGSTTAAPALFQTGSLLTTPVAHAVEWDGTNLYVSTSAASRKTIAYADGNITGSAATLTTARNITASGDASWTVSFNGSADVTAALTIANNAVTLAKLADISTGTFLGRVSSGTGDPEVLAASQAAGMLDLALINSTVQSLGTNGYVEIGGIKLQWGHYAGGSATPTVSFPTAFGGAAWAVLVSVVSDDGGGGSGGWKVAARNDAALGTTSFTAKCGQEDGGTDVIQPATNVKFDWIAVGPA